MRFFGQIDSNRTPGDTSSTPDAAGGSELVGPGSQFVSHPLAESCLGGGPHTAAVDVGKAHGEAGVPPAPAFCMMAGDVADVFDGRAEARRTDHRATRTRQTSARNIVPSWMLEILVEQLLDAGRVDAAHLLPRCAFDAGFRLAQIGIGGGRRLHFG